MSLHQRAFHFCLASQQAKDQHAEKIILSRPRPVVPTDRRAKQRGWTDRRHGLLKQRSDQISSSKRHAIIVREPINGLRGSMAHIEFIRDENNFH